MQAFCHGFSYANYTSIPHEATDHWDYIIVSVTSAPVDCQNE